MASVTNSDTDENIETLRNKERHPDDIESGLAANELAALDQIEAGLGDKTDSNWKTSVESSPSGKKSILARIVNRKTAGVGVVAGLVAVAGFGLFGILSGPMQIVHFSQLLQQFHFTNNDEFANGRSSRYLFHRIRSGSVGYAKMQTRLGRTGNRVADVMEIKLQREAGLRSLYDTRTGFMVGYEIVDENKAINTLISAEIDPNLDLEIREGVVGDVVGFEGKTGNKGRVLLFKTDAAGRQVSFKIRRDFHRAVTRTIKMNGLASAIGFRKTAVRGALDLHPIKRYTRQGRESFVEYSRNLRKRWSDEAKNGTRVPDDPDLKIKVENSEDIVPASEEIDRVGREVKADAAKDKASAKAKAKSNLTKVGSIGSVGIGTLCAARGISKNIETVKHANIVLPLMRVGSRIISLGSQVMTGQDLDVDTLGVVSESLHDEAIGSWSIARSIQHELGQEPSGPEIPATAKPSRTNDKPRVLEIVDDVFEAIPGVGGAACSRLGQFLIDAVSGQLIVGAVTEVIGTLASAAGVNPVDMFVEWLTDTLAGDMVNVDATGADLGNIANYGARLAANEHAISMGGARLSSTEAAQLDMLSGALVSKDFENKSFFARIFDISEPNSLLAKTVFENDTVASLFSNPGSILTRIPGYLANVLAVMFGSFNPRVLAAQDYDYGFDEYGFTLDEQHDERFDDPYENARIVEGELGLENLNNKYGKCFSTKINPHSGAIEGSETMSYSQLEQNDSLCSDRSNLELMRYRFYIADSILLKSISCYDGDESACVELGFHGLAGSPVTPGGITADPSLPPPDRIGASNAQRMSWENLEYSDEIGPKSDGSIMKAYVREPTSTTNIKTVVIVGSVHGSENAGQFVAYDMLFRAQLPSNIRVIAIPEVLPQSSIASGLRKNANGVDLNRNFPQNWGNIHSDKCTVSQPSCTFYRGPSPASEAETQTLMNYLSNLGKVDLFLVYHDNLNYVAPVGDTSHSLASTYANVAGMHGQCAENPSAQNCPIKTVWQSGSIDWWYNSTIGSPTILVEMGQDQSAETITRHVDAIVAVLGGS